MKTRSGIWVAFMAVMLVFGAACDQGTQTTAPTETAESDVAAPTAIAEMTDGPGVEGEAEGMEPLKDSAVIGVIAKSQSNPVFQAARTGAVDAAAELSEKYGVDISIDWRTPNTEDAQQQANFIEQLANQGVDGISISCSDASKVTPAINDAVMNKGVVVVCFDSDAPDSERMAYHGVDDAQCGADVLNNLVQFMDEQGKVAILAGNQNAPNLQRRVQGVRDAAAAYPDIEIVDVYYHPETPQDAASRVEQAMQARPDIGGWAMVGGWPLFTDNALNWAPGEVKVVSVDALPPQLDYLRSGHVQMLLAQQVYKWGYRSVELLVDKILFDKEPESERDISELVPVTQDEADEFAKNWDVWLKGVVTE